MNMVKKVAMVIIMENDLQAAVDFYKKLGLKLVFHVPGRWAEFKINDLQIGLCPTDEKVQYNRTGIVFEVADLAAFYEDQKDSLNFMDKPVDAAHGVMTSIQDPSGNILDLYQPTPEKIKELAEKMKNEPSLRSDELRRAGDACCGGGSCESEEVQEADSCCESEAGQGGCC